MNGANPFSAVVNSSRPVSWTEAGIQTPAPPEEVLSQEQFLRREVEAWQGRSAKQASDLVEANEEIVKLQLQLQQLQLQLQGRPNLETAAPVANPPPPGDAAAELANFYGKYPRTLPRRTFRPVAPYGPVTSLALPRNARRVPR